MQAVVVWFKHNEFHLDGPHAGKQVVAFVTAPEDAEAAAARGKVLIDAWFAERKRSRSLATPMVTPPHVITEDNSNYAHAVETGQPWVD